MRTFNRKSLIPDDFVALGQCFSSTIPVDQFALLDPNDFFNNAKYFIGVQFQPNSTYIDIVSKLTE